MKEKSIKLNAVLNVMKTVLSLVFPLITFPYITRVLQVNAIGKYDFSVSIISYFSLIAALGITTYAVREGTKYRGNQEKMNQFASEIFSINLYFKSGAYLNDIIVLIGKVTHVGHTSMEVRVDTYREEQDGTRHPINRAYFVMVAMGDDGKPTPVPGLILENEGERMEWDNAIKRRELRLVRKKEGF